MQSGDQRMRPETTVQNAVLCPIPVTARVTSRGLLIGRGVRGDSSLWIEMRLWPFSSSASDSVAKLRARNAARCDGNIAASVSHLLAQPEGRAYYLW
jgi:hypothetical protein